MGGLEQVAAERHQRGTTGQQPLQSGAVKALVAAHGEAVDLAAGRAEHLPVHLGQRFPLAAVHDGVGGGAGAPPAGVVVEAGNPGQAQFFVVVGTSPLGGIDVTPFEGHQDFIRRQVPNIGAQLRHDRAAKARDPDFQALEVGDLLRRLPEPAAHLGTGVARCKRHRPEIPVEAVDGLVAATTGQPGILLLRIEAKGEVAGKGKGRISAEVVVAGGMAALHVTGLHRIQHLGAGRQFTDGIGDDVKPPATEGPQPLSDGNSAAVGHIQGCRPAGGHAPANGRQAAAG